MSGSEAIVSSMEPVIEEEVEGVIVACPEEEENDDEDNNVNDDDSELDLFPGGLELPPLRSPRGSIHSLYGGSNCSSRRNSNCSQGSNASTISWSSLQALRLAAVRARSTSLPQTQQNSVYEYSLLLSEADPSSLYKQGLTGEPRSRSPLLLAPPSGGEEDFAFNSLGSKAKRPTGKSFEGTGPKK